MASEKEWEITQNTYIFAGAPRHGRNRRDEGGEERYAKHLRRLRGERMHRQAPVENRHIDDRHESPSHEEPKRFPWSH